MIRKLFILYIYIIDTDKKKRKKKKNLHFYVRKLVKEKPFHRRGNESLDDVK